MDIGKGKGGPAAELSNFPPGPFIFDGVEVASMEGLLQAFKSPYPHIQIEACKKVGLAAKRWGQKRKWWKIQKLYWLGKEYDRHSPEYQQLLDRAFDAMFDQNEKKRRALLATGNAVFRHSVGKHDPSRTVLTEAEFCSRLTRNRARLQAQLKPR